MVNKGRASLEQEVVFVMNITAVFSLSLAVFKTKDLIEPTLQSVLLDKWLAMLL